ncbi:MAG: Dabb family protein [Bacteroidales bacterium]
MLRHIVMFKLKETPGKKENIQRLKQAIQALQDRIGEVKSMETGINVNSKPAAYDLVLVSDFEDEAALEKYRVHPEHKKVLELIKEVNDQIAVVDYHCG